MYILPQFCLHQLCYLFDTILILGCIDEKNKCHPINTQWPVQKCFIKTCEQISEGLVGEKFVSEGNL